MNTIIKPPRKVFSGLSKTFRGGIPENCARFKFSGDGYISMPPEQRGEFQIQSARHVAGPMRALVDDFVRLVHIIGATQVLKSIVGDAWVIYVLEHVLKPMLVLFEDEGKADLYCKGRLMETINRHPFIEPMLQDAKKENRFNVTGNWIKTAMMQMLVAGLNEGNVSSISWPLVWISEAWMHGNDGLMWKAYKRTDRFIDYKILNESQASRAGTDLHKSASEAHQVPLIWKCPACAGPQTWEWHHWNHKRPADFQPRTVTGIETPKPGTYAGMRIMDDGGGTNSIEERAKAAYWECIWCGYHIEDTRANRQTIMDGYEQNYLIEKNGIVSVPEKVTFTLPYEAARDNFFRKTVSKFLIAKHDERQGLKTTIADWMMNERALFFSEEMLQPQIVQVTEHFNPAEKIPNWHHDGMEIDCQKHKTLNTVGTFHWSVDSADKNGNSFEIGRGFAIGWDELVAIQKKFKVRNRHVNIDGRKWTPEILRQAAMNKELAEGEQYGRPIKYWSCWNVLLGDAPARQYPWPDKQHRIWAPPTRRVEIIIEKGQRIAVSVFMYRWSNLSVKDLLNEILIGGEGKVKFVALPREALTPQDQLIETGNMTYDAQMSSEVRTEKNGRAYWEKIGNRANHRWDIACMRLVRLLREGLIGYVAEREEENK